MKSDTIQNPGSFRDPSGSVFFYEGQLYRKIDTSYREDYEAVNAKGLYDRLVRERLLLPHGESPLFLDNDPNIFKIIRPEFLPFISYPYEWCFSQLKDAGLTTLRIQKTCLHFGMSLKDSSSYDVQNKVSIFNAL